MRAPILKIVSFLPALCLCLLAHAEPFGQPGIAFFRAGVTVPKDATLEVHKEIALKVYSSTNVAPRQSLSLAVSWPAGYAHESKLGILRHNAWTLGAPALLFIFYMIAWLSIGPEPKPGVVVARYEPPAGLSPAAARYMAKRTTDGRSFAAVIAQLAARGCIRVELAGGKYKLSRLMSDRATEGALAPEENRTLELLFEDGSVIELSPAMDERNTAQNGRYIFQIHEELAKQLGKKYFTRHTGFIVIGVLATFISSTVIAVIASGPEAFGAVPLTFWVLFCGLMLGMLIELSFITAWRTALRTRMGWTKMLPGTAAIAVFGGFIFFVLTKLAEAASPSYSLTLVAFLAVNLVWGPLLKRKTQLGREICDQIAGFRQFLQKVEEDKLNRMHPSGDAPEDMDRFVPYAIALEVRAAWGDHLSQTFLPTTGVVE